MHEENKTTTTSPEVTASDPEKGETNKVEKPYSIYTKREKWFLVGMIALTGLFSPLTTNIYFPAIPTLSAVFHKSTELINLTVTMYMVFQGISPMFFGTLADNVGRRLIYAACLLILSLASVGLALVPTSKYWLLLFLRCFQSAGSASTIALGAGVIGDIAESSERGGFFGLYQSGPLLAPAIGPVIGGGLAGSLGWRSIFWFIAIAAVSACFLVLLFLPETLRAIVGDGSVQPSIIHRPIIPVVGRNRIARDPSEPLPRKKAPRNPFVLLKNADIAIILFFNGVVCAVYYAVTATISTLFSAAYPFLDETQIGLCFLSIGGGMFAGSLSSGRILDSEFRRISKGLSAAPEANKKESPGGAKYGDHFPIEKARLRLLPFVMIVYVGCNLGYGWCIQKQVHISVPLILQFIIGYTAILVMNASATFIIDLVPTQSSSVSACNNLVRGLMGAALVSVIDLIANALHPGWTFVLLGCVCAALTPSVYLVMKIGPSWRAKRIEKERALANLEEAMHQAQ